MAKIKTYRLNCTLMAGTELYHRNSLHVEGKMVPDIELEFKENPQYFIEHSYVEVPDPKPVAKKKEVKTVPVVKKEVEKPVEEKKEVEKPVVKKAVSKKKVLKKKKKKVVKGE